MKNFILAGCLLALSATCLAQTEETNTSQLADTTAAPQVIRLDPSARYESPYKISWKADVPIIAAGIGLSYLGVRLIDAKDDLAPAELAEKTADKVPFFDRHSAGWFDKKADDISYPPFHAAFAMPVVVGLLDKNQRQNYGHVLVMYLETMAITGALFTMTAPTVARPRPFVYKNPDGPNRVDDAYRSDGNNQRSFYAGHTAATAAATFYTAKVFHDFHPGSKARTYVWIAAAAVPAFVGYMRHKAGMHFLSDNIVGYAVGAATGILVPHFHKKKIKNLSITPQAGTRYQGIAAVYKF